MIHKNIDNSIYRITFPTKPLNNNGDRMLSGAEIHEVEEVLNYLLGEKLKKTKEIIICAAVKTNTGKIIRGHRHSDCYMAMRARRLSPPQELDTEGFITSTNRFVGREEALEIQKEAGIKSVCSSGYCDSERLFSEDLY